MTWVIVLGLVALSCGGGDDPVGQGADAPRVVGVYQGGHRFLLQTNGFQTIPCPGTLSIEDQVGRFFSGSLIIDVCEEVTRFPLDFPISGSVTTEAVDLRFSTLIEDPFSQIFPTLDDGCQEQSADAEFTGIVADGSLSASFNVIFDCGEPGTLGILWQVDGDLVDPSQ